MCIYIHIYPHIHIHIYTWICDATRLPPRTCTKTTIIFPFVSGRTLHARCSASRFCKRMAAHVSFTRFTRFRGHGHQSRQRPFAACTSQRDFLSYLEHEVLPHQTLLGDGILTPVPLFCLICTDISNKTGIFDEYQNTPQVLAARSFLVAGFDTHVIPRSTSCGEHKDSLAVPEPPVCDSMLRVLFVDDFSRKKQKANDAAPITANIAGPTSGGSSARNTLEYDAIVLKDTALKSARDAISQVFLVCMYMNTCI